MIVSEYKFGKATVRIHGNPDREKIEAATLKFLKAAEIQRKKVLNEARKETHTGAKEADPATKAES